MRRHAQLWPRIIAFQNLLRAARLAQRGKRFKPATAQFNFFLEGELWQLHEELATQRYRPGLYHHFWIVEPKRRIISAAPYRDRIVHHALHNILEPIFDPTFIHDSYATRTGKGTHAAIARFQQFAHRARYALKCDIRQYFPTIRHDCLLALIRRKVSCPETLWLIQTILDAGGVDAPAAAGTSLASIHPSIHPSMGIPIGNLTSQFFANIYLNGLDHFIKERLRCRYYLRYMDDFVLLHDDKPFLWAAKAAIQRYLYDLQLSLHEGKCRIFDTTRGVPFLGLVVAPHWRRLKRANLLRFKQRLRRFQWLDRRGAVAWGRIHQSIQAWIGHARHAGTGRLRELLLSAVVFKRGPTEGG